MNDYSVLYKTSSSAVTVTTYDANTPNCNVQVITVFSISGTQNSGAVCCHMDFSSIVALSDGFIAPYVVPLSVSFSCCFAIRLT